MIKLVEKDKEKLLKFLKKYIEECIYICIDLEKYGTTNPNVKFWYNEKNDQIETVIMKYYDSFQLFCTDDTWEPNEILYLIKKYKVTTICGKSSMIKKLEYMLPNYNTNYGIIVCEDTYREFKQFDLVEMAKPEDAVEIAELMCTDQEFRENYTIQELGTQLADRIREGIGRSYVIKEGSKIVAHSGTFIENDSLAVASGLIVDKNYSNKFYGLIIHEYLKKEIINEGKKVYVFRVKEKRKRYTQIANNNICGVYGKMTRRTD